MPRLETFEEYSQRKDEREPFQVETLEEYKARGGKVTILPAHTKKQAERKIAMDASKE